MNQNDEIWEQMDKDFEEYEKLMAAGMYPKAEQVERSIREIKQRNPNMSEEFMWKLAVAAIAAEKRLKKEFFPVDHNEDPPTPKTVEILMKCWHIMPLVRDEDEGETWWVLGPNNKAAQESSTAGPFKTRKEAFWVALEHNRTLGVNAVYVHSRDENGEIGDGDFQEPSEENFDDDDEPAEQLTPLEQSFMEVGDQAMKNVLADLRKEEQAASHAPKRRRKPMSKQEILTVTAMVAFGAIILSHYTGWVTIRVKAGEWREVTTWHRVGAEAYVPGSMELKVPPGTTFKDEYLQYPITTWREYIGPDCYRSYLKWVDPSLHPKNPYADKVLIQDIRMPLFVLAVFYAGLLFPAKKGSEVTCAPTTYQNAGASCHF